MDCPVHERRNRGPPRGQLACQFQSFGHDRGRVKTHARDVAARAAEVGDQPGSNGISANREYDWYCRRRRLRCQGRRGAANRGDRRNLPADQIGGQRRQSLVIALRPTVFDRDVATLGKTRLVEALVERGHDESQL